MSCNGKLEHLGVQMASFVLDDNTTLTKQSAAAITQKYTEVVCKIVLIGKVY